MTTSHTALNISFSWCYYSDNKNKRKSWLCWGFWVEPAVYQWLEWNVACSFFFLYLLLFYFILFWCVCVCVCLSVCVYVILSISHWFLSSRFSFFLVQADRRLTTCHASRRSKGNDNKGNEHDQLRKEVETIKIITWSTKFNFFPQKNGIDDEKKRSASSSSNSLTF